ncbi:uncharacterized protein KY384_008077 [Bacidia gigantensis]|uniref:uncharacterized protein n=1 Tax=Bacidia gigantensis TaxID=2732470 RepID=UPI001D03D6C1|nr:uncharacterized protein KY384_008077 [Bacidia gigantensis]KAG8526648.1 hypothetical protein KY384_008077 [Bacidia gigantensis]
MGRPKIDPSLRRRTAKACEPCKRRKQKCVYDSNEHEPHDEPTDQLSPSSSKSRATNFLSHPQKDSADEETSTHRKKIAEGHSFQDWKDDHGEEVPSIHEAVEAARSHAPADSNSEADIKLPTTETTAGDFTIEEADNHMMTRMMEDGGGSGRLLYIGDSSTLSFLQLLRMIIETASGPSKFTLNPGRHRVTEPELTLSSHRPPPTYLLPDKTAALMLVDSYFTNLQGIVEALDEKDILATLAQCYFDPLTVDPIGLGNLFFVFAIGLSLATPRDGSKEAEVINKLRSNHAHQSEIFYFTAKNLSNPVDNLENAGFSSVQAMTLMGIYNCIRSKRSTAYSVIGAAVRCGYSLGLHREETLDIFPLKEKMARKKLWRTLFVLDRFLAVALGRPVAIAEEESSGSILQNRDNIAAESTKSERHDLCTAGLEASVRACHVLGHILRRIYTQRKVCIREAQQLIDECKSWPENLDPSLHWKQASPENLRQAIVILHCNVAYCQTIILLTRPFFLHLLGVEIQRTRLNVDENTIPPKQPKMMKFSDACVIAATHNVALCQNAYRGGYLARLNPLSTDSLFSSALIIFANQYARPSGDAVALQCMQDSIIILRYCGVYDPQARHGAVVLEEFQDVIHADARRASSTATQGPTKRKTSNQFTSSPTSSKRSSNATAMLSRNTSAFSATSPPTSVTPSAHIPEKPPRALASETSREEPFSDGLFSGFLDMGSTVLPVAGPPDQTDEEFYSFDNILQWPSEIFPSFQTPAIQDTLYQPPGI